jgi:MFS family permease
MGALADRFGRRRLIIIALGGFAVANIAFLLAQSAGAFIGIRLFEGAITAGLLPASMAVVGDIVSEKERARWVGILMGSYSAGFIFGPAAGGFLYDHWGFTAPFAVSAGLAALGLVLASILVPDTRSETVKRRAANRQQASRQDWLTTLPRPLYILMTLLILDFIAVFGFAFIEPRMVFYFYDDLAFTTTQFGLIVGVYGLAIVFGQFSLGQLSDRLGRKPVIALGFGINVTFYLSLTVFSHFGLIFLAAVLAGLGNALLMPALSAYYIDLASEEHRSRVLGLKESAAALGGVVGPLAVALVNPWTTPQGVFTIAGFVMIAAVMLALVVLGRDRLRPDKKLAESPLPTAGVVSGGK